MRILIGLILLAGIIILQIFLSKRENKWLGFILPAISFLISIIFIMALPVTPNDSTASIIMQLVSMFLLSNIPTVILLAIYFAFREKWKKKKQIDRMNIQDLQ